MREVLPELAAGILRGETLGLSRVVRTYHSAPRPPGAAMVRCADGSVVGSISGGCVEGAVFELAGEVLESGVPKLERYGVSDDDAFAVGLTCGGILDVFVEPVDGHRFPELEAFAQDIAQERAVALVSVIAHPDEERLGAHLVVRSDEVEGTLGDSHVDAVVAEDVRGLLEQGASATLSYGLGGERQGDGLEIFVASFAPRPRMIVFGAIDFSAALARQGALLGYHVTVCDARSLFATHERFPGVDELVVDWPHRYLRSQIEAGAVDSRTAVCVLTHDPKFDVPALQAAFDLPEGAFLGAMGSRRTHEDRLRRLREAGATDADIGRINSPIGLDLGARTPAETAVSIVAQLVATRWGGRAEPLTATTGPIHRERPDQDEHRGTRRAGAR